MAEDRKMAEQTFTTPEGAVMAILPLAELERLREAAEDAGLARIAAEVERKLVAGEDELISWEMSKRLLGGENPVRVWREHRELTIDKLAGAAGISQPYLSQIETGQRDGTFKVMVALARALEIDLDDLAPPIEGGAAQDRYAVVPAKAATVFDTREEANDAARAASLAEDSYFWPAERKSGGWIVKTRGRRGVARVTSGDDLTLSRKSELKQTARNARSPSRRRIRGVTKGD